MKSNRVIIAAILVAALMVMPIALFTSDDDSSADTTTPMDFSSIMSTVMGLSPQDISALETLGKLAAGMEYTPTEPKNVDIDTNQTYNSGEMLQLKDYYNFTDGQTITMKSGSAIVMCVGQDFSIESAAKFGATIFEPGAVFLIVNTFDGVTPSISEEDEKVIYKNVFSDTDNGNYYLKGKVSYSMKINATGKISAAISAVEGTRVTDNSTLKDATGIVDFPSENRVVVDIEMKTNTEQKVRTIENGKVETKIDMTMTSIDGKNNTVYKLEGNGSYSVNASIPMEVGGTLTGSAKGNIEISLGITFDGENEYKATFKNSVDVSIQILKYKDTKDQTATFGGSISFEFNYDKLKVVNDDSTIDMTGLGASVTVKFNESGFELSVGAGLGSIVMTPKEGRESYIKDVRADFVYGAEVDITKMKMPALAADPMISSASSSSSSSPMAMMTMVTDGLAAMMKEYLAGVVDGTKEATIQQYASSFFLKKIDEKMKFDQEGLTSKYIRASFSIGSIAMYNDTVFELEGLSLNAEISDSVGVSASFDMKRLMVATDGMKVMVQPVSASINTYTGEDKDKYVFTVSAVMTGEMKMFASGRLVSNPYVNNFSETINLGVDAKTSKLLPDIVEIKADELVANSYGIDSSAKNLKFNKETGLVEVDKITVSGYYYGSASMVKEVSGTYNNVTFEVGSPMGALFANMVSESYEITFTDIYGNKLTTNVYYDAEKQLMMYNMSSEGEYWLFDTMADPNLESALLMTDIKDAPDDPKKQYNFSGNIVVNNASTTESPTDTDYTMIIDGKNATLRYSKLGPVVEGGFTGTVYVTCDSLGMYAYKTFVKDNDTSYTLDMINGSALGITVDADGKVSYSIMALAGNYIGTETSPTGFEIGEVKDGKADVTITGTTLRYVASPMPYKIIIDGSVAKDEVKYRSSGISVENLAKDIVMLVDKNGKMYGTVEDGTWSLGGQYLYPFDLDLTSVKAKDIAEVKTTEINNVDGQAARFTMPSSTSPVQFKLSSNVQFSIEGVSSGSAVDLAAQETTFDGKKAFIIKASADGVPIEATFLIPVSNATSKLMHVDEYGRICEQASKVVVIGDEQFIQATTNDYSIFYVDSDEPRYNVPGGGSDNMLLFIAIGAVVAVVAVAGVFFFIKKH